MPEAGDAGSSPTDSRDRGRAIRLGRSMAGIWNRDFDRVERLVDLVAGVEVAVDAGMAAFQEECFGLGALGIVVVDSGKVVGSDRICFDFRVVVAIRIFFYCGAPVPHQNCISLGRIRYLPPFHPPFWSGNFRDRRRIEKRKNQPTAATLFHNRLRHHLSLSLNVALPR